MDRHILGLSGGKDSAALAIYMNQNYPELNIEYFFTDTGHELPEVYKFLDKLESTLNISIARLKPEIGEYVEKRNEAYPQLTDHYFTGEYPVKLIDELGDNKITQLSLLSTGSNN